MIGFENPAALLIIVIAPILIILAIKNRRSKYKTILFCSKALTILLLALALSQPYIITETDTEVTQEVEIIQDKSLSSQLIETSEIDPDTTVETTDGLNRQLKNVIEEERDIVLISDLQHNLDTIDPMLENSESQINLVKKDLIKDTSVSIDGPEETIPGRETRYTVKVQSTTSEKPNPEVTVNGQTIEPNQKTNNRWYIDKTFDAPGDQEIKATIPNEGEYSQNTEYYKSVDVIEKPEILMIGEDGYLEQELSEVYDITNTQNQPDDLSNYETIIVKEPEAINSDLKDYVSQGNGIVYTGSPKDSSLLPMREGEAVEQENTIEETSDSVILIDSSISREGEDLRNSKAMAMSLIRSMPDSNRVGLATYNERGYELTQLQELYGNREEIESKISRIESQGPTFHQEGLKTAENMLNGDGNIIMITDGLLSRVNEIRGVPEDTRDTAEQINSNLIILDTNPVVNPEFLQELTKKTNGEYVTANNHGTLSFVFEAQETEQQYYRLHSLDSTHFIARENNLNTQTRAKQDTKVKENAQHLLMTGRSNPYLATWRYGLGRVVQINDQDPNLGRLSRQDPRLLSRTVGWAVGEPEEEGITIKGDRKPETVEIYSRENGDLLARLEKDEIGFHRYDDNTFSYNYNKGLENLGYNERNIEKLIDGTEGEHIEDYQRWLENYEEESRTTEVTDRLYLSNYLLIVLIAIFLGEVGYRKLNGKK